jgi:hypothetical protein
MREKSWFRVPRRKSGHVQRAHDLTAPLVERIEKAARTLKVRSKVRSVKKAKWTEHVAKRRATP